MPSRFDNSNDLHRPGAGLPKLEHAALDAIFKSTSAILSDKQALRLFRRESTELMRLCSDDDSYDIFQSLLIPRVIGIEDSSRNWSVLMVMEHLYMTNRDMLDIVTALMSGIIPRGSVDIAMYKPADDVGYDVLERYQDLTDEYVMAIEGLLESRGNLHSVARYRHPWFGPLTAHQWHVLSALHQRIHRRQMKKLVAMLGVT